MEEILEKMKGLPREEMDTVMKAVEAWFGEHYPDWDVVYIALQKEPERRKQQFAGIFRLLMKDLDWSEKEYRKLLGK